MITFFKKGSITYYAIDADHTLSNDEIQKLKWLLGNAEVLDNKSIAGTFIGPRREMITPWSTNAVETTHCGVSPTEGMLYVFVCECLADAFRDATM